MSKGPGAFGAVFCVHSPEDTNGEGDKRVRIFAQAGRDRWARDCTAAARNGSHYGCTVCGGLGLVEDCPS